MIRQLSYIGLIYAIFLIIFATILFVPFNFHPEHYILNLNPFNWLNNEDSIWNFMVEKIPNIILFMPLGLFLPIVFKKYRNLVKTASICFIMTFSVEFFQYFIGRSSDIVDLITNLLGGILGYLLFVVIDKIFKNNTFYHELRGD